MSSRRAIATWMFGAFALVACAGHALAQSPSLPIDKGLPIRIKLAVAFVEVPAFNENAGTFKGTVDVRLRWEDPRLRRPAEEATDPPRVYRGADVQAQLATMWVPEAELVNQRDKATFAATGLRVFPDGQVELIRRTTAEFTTPFEVERFPFDRQRLRLEIAIRNLTTDAVALEFAQDDLDFSRVAAGATLDGWNFGLVTLRSEPLVGWYGASHARVLASLEVTRQSGAVVAAIFIPLFASLLIPMLGIWLNPVEDGRFQIDAFEFVNLIVGGLFAVIALNFTINSMFQVLNTGDNPISRLFALNYAALAASLLVNVLLFRFAVPERLLGRYVQEQLYLFLAWAIPLLCLATAVAIVLVAVV